MSTIQTTGQKAIVRYAILAGQPWGSAIVDVVEIDGDHLRYTTDGIWFSDARRGSQYSDWELIDPQAEFEAPETDPAEADPAEAQLFCRCGSLAVIVTPHGIPMCRKAAVMAGFGPQVPSSPTCPLHGADCEAWA